MDKFVGEMLPLHMAVFNKEHAPRMIRLLVRLGANVNARTKRRGGAISTTALEIACGEGSPEAIRTLLDLGARVRAIFCRFISDTSPGRP